MTNLTILLLPFSLLLQHLCSLGHGLYYLDLSDLTDCKSHLMISIVGVAVAGVEVVLSFERVFCADPSFSARDCKVLQSKLPVPLCAESYYVRDYPGILCPGMGLGWCAVG